MDWTMKRMRLQLGHGSVMRVRVISPGNSVLSGSGIGRILFGFVLLLVIVSTPLSLDAFERRDTKNILILNSYDADLPLIRAITRGVQAENRDWNISYFTENMDACRFPCNDHLSVLEQLYRRKYRSVKPDLIIAVGDHAVDFLAERDTLFAGVPVVFAELADSKPVRELPPSFCGIRLPTDITGTVDLALRLHPGIKHLAVVCGTLPLDRIFEARARSALAGYEKKIDIIWIANLPTNKSIEQIASLPKGTVVLALPFLKGDFLPVDHTKPFVSQVSSLAHSPLYTLWSTQVGKGMVGGYVLDFAEVGSRLGKIGVQILNGEEPSSRLLSQDDLLRFRFDWRELHRWGISEDRLPRSSFVEFRKPPIWIEYKKDVVFIAVVISLQALFILILLINRNSLNRARIALTVSEQRFSSFFRHLPIGCIIFRFVRDAAGEIVDMEILDANIVAGKDMNCASSNLIGARVCELFGVETLPHFEYFRQLAESGDPQTFESYCQLSDCWLLCSASVLMDDLYSLVAVNMTERKKIEEQNRETEERLKGALEAANRISRYMETVREKERKYIAREIHDELGQALTALKIDLFRLKSRPCEPREDYARAITQMSNLVSNIIQDVQRISSELRPRMLDDLGLVPAIEWLVQDFSDRMEIPCIFDSRNAGACTGTACATAVFRIVQESLTNICRHAQASRVEITLDCGEGKAFLEIIDDGVGISGEHLSSEESLGLLGIMERAHMCGGKADIVGQPGKGTTVTAVIPCSGNGVLNHEDIDC